MTENYGATVTLLWATETSQLEKIRQSCILFIFLHLI